MSAPIVDLCKGRRQTPAMLPKSSDVDPSGGLHFRLAVVLLGMIGLPRIETWKTEVPV